MKKHVLSAEIQKRIKNINPILLSTILSWYYKDNTDSVEIKNIKAEIKAIKSKLGFIKNYKPHSEDYWEIRGWNKEEIKDRILVRNKEWYISKFGKIEGEIKWQKYTNANSPKSKKQEKRIKRKNIQINKKNGIWDNTLSSYKIIYGEVLGELNYKEFCFKSSHPNKNKGIKLSLDNYIEKYGDIEGKLKFDRRYKQERYQASRASLFVFLPLLNYLNKLEIFDVSIGYNGSKEFKLFYNDKKNWYYYDFTIHSKKIIIEFNGIKYHTDRDRDFHKKQVAEKVGYKVLELWSTETPDRNLELAIQFINDEK
jgi:hypothetical protein